MNLEELRKLADSFFEWPTEDKTQVTLTSALLFADHVLRMAAPGGEAVFKLHPDASSEKGDLVTIGKDESTGFREFTGPLGVRVGDFSYPIYRKFIDPAPIPTSERLPTEADADCDGRVFVWMHASRGKCWLMTHWLNARHGDYWLPTGLTMPPAPGGEG